jgi:hypothetical protein
VSEWLDLMLDEIARKKREQAEAEKERRRRAEERDETAATDTPPAQSK